VNGAVAYYNTYKNIYKPTDYVFKIQDSTVTLRIPKSGFINKLKQILGRTSGFESKSTNLLQFEERSHSERMGLPYLSDPQTYPEVSKYTKDQAQETLDKFRDGLSKKGTPTPEQCFFMKSLLQHAEDNNFTLEYPQGVDAELKNFNDLNNSILNGNVSPNQTENLKKWSQEGDFGAEQWLKRINSPFESLKEAITQGSPEALHTLKEAAGNGNAQALQILKELADIHNGAKFELGKLHLEGKGVEENFTEAFTLIKATADAGHPGAKTTLPEARSRLSQEQYMEGKALLKKENPSIDDLREALRFINTAKLTSLNKNEEAAKALPEAKYRLGTAILESKNDLASLKEAFELLQDSAKNDNTGAVQALPVSQYRYGTEILKQENLTLNDLTIAVKLFSEAADKGNEDAFKALPNAQTLLGNEQYRLSNEILGKNQADIAQLEGALKSLILAANNGNQEAIQAIPSTRHLIANQKNDVARKIILEAENPSLTDLTKAVEYMTEAAKRGIAIAEVTLPSARLRLGNEQYKQAIQILDNSSPKTNPNDLIKALKLLNSARKNGCSALKGKVPDFYKIGVKLLEISSDGIILDHGVRLLKVAAANGNEEAEKALPEALYTAGTKIYSKAMDKLKQLGSDADDEDSRIALRNLENGLQFIQDAIEISSDSKSLSQGAILLEEAAAKGYEKAQQALPRALYTAGTKIYSEAMSDLAKLGPDENDESSRNDLLKNLENGLQLISDAADSGNKEAQAIVEAYSQQVAAAKNHPVVPLLIETLKSNREKIEFPNSIQDQLNLDLEDKTDYTQGNETVQVVNQYKKDNITRALFVQFIEEETPTEDVEKARQEIRDSVDARIAADLKLNAAIKGNGSEEEIASAERELESKRKEQIQLALHGVDSTAGNDQKWRLALQAVCTQSLMNQIFTENIYQYTLHMNDPDHLKKIDTYGLQELKYKMNLPSTEFRVHIQRDSDNQITSVRVEVSGHLDLVNSDTVLIGKAVEKKVSFNVSLEETGKIKISDYQVDATRELLTS